MRPFEYLHTSLLNAHSFRGYLPKTSPVLLMSGSGIVVANL